jgi:polysaccharide export outer membrane protein
VNSNKKQLRAPASGQRQSLRVWPLWLLTLASFSAPFSVCAQQDVDAPPLSFTAAPHQASAPPPVMMPAVAPAPRAATGTPSLSFSNALSLPDNLHPSDVALNAPSPLAPKSEAAAQAAMPSAIPSDADAAPLMKLGPGDMVSMQVYGRPELTTSAYISDDGMLNTPLAGPVQVAGMSPTEAASKVSDAYRSGGFLLQPQVNITLQQFKSQQISVLGEVKNPGRYTLDSRTSIFDLLAQAGGATGDAAETIFLIRQGDGKNPAQRIPVTMQELVKHSAGELALRGGDSIYIPKAPQFYIYGEVRTPSRYRLDGGMTVVQAIAMGGGVTERGSDSRIEIRRRNPDGSFKTISARATDAVQADDVIRIKERIF